MQDAASVRVAPGRIATFTGDCMGRMGFPRRGGGGQQKAVCIGDDESDRCKEATAPGVSVTCGRGRQRK